MNSFLSNFNLKYLLIIGILFMSSITYSQETYRENVGDYNAEKKQMQEVYQRYLESADAQNDNYDIKNEQSYIADITENSGENTNEVQKEIRSVPSKGFTFSAMSKRISVSPQKFQFQRLNKEQLND